MGVEVADRGKMGRLGELVGGAKVYVTTPELGADATVTQCRAV